MNKKAPVSHVNHVDIFRGPSVHFKAVLRDVSMVSPAFIYSASGEKLDEERNCSLAPPSVLVTVQKTKADGLRRDLMGSKK